LRIARSPGVKQKVQGSWGPYLKPAAFQGKLVFEHNPEIVAALESEKIQEVFGVGTAATIAPIQSIGHEGREYPLPAIDKRIFSKKVYEELDGIKHGIRPDPFGWIVRM
jgi:branched-subunit amino acid aminotransferase/4-amino-4-deoxychorismate lyase